MKLFFSVGAAAFFCATSAFAQSATPSSAEFAMKASVGNTFEVQESQLALKQSTDAKVKAFAKMMIKDHSKAEKKLIAAAKPMGGDVKMMLDPPHQSMVDALGKDTTDFDKMYIADQVKAHNDTVALLTDYSKNGDDPKLQAWAKKTLPTVKKHLKHVEMLSM
jgi:putative membrane protein